MRIRFPAYRRYKASLVAVNDAMVALMIGARLGQHQLATSPASPTSRLPDLYGGIPGINRVNRTVGEAADLLASAEDHLASMGIPYVLGVHAALLSDAIAMLREDGNHDPSSTRHAIKWHADPTQIKLSEIHEYFMERSGERLDGILLEQFHLARRIRNRILHFGGTAGPRLPGEYGSMSPDARDRWEAITGRPLTVGVRDRLVLADGELIAVLAFTRALGRRVSEALGETLSRQFWIRTVANDYREFNPQKFGEKDQRARRLKGFARTYYGPLGLTTADFEEEQLE